MTAHVIDIENTQASDARDRIYAAPRYRWRCSCGAAGSWKIEPRSARQGGTRHAAMSERAPQNGGR